MSTAADKLARTRHAIVAQLHRSERGREGREPDADDAGQRQPGLAGPQLDPLPSSQRRWPGMLQRAAGAWWRQHPAHAGLELAKPVLSTCAARKPAQFLGAAAAAGALFVLARGWRLVPVAGLLAALVKSSPPSGFVLAAMAAADVEKDQRGPVDE